MYMMRYQGKVLEVEADVNGQNKVQVPVEHMVDV